MDPQALKAQLGVALLILLLALAMLPFQPRGSAEFVVSILAAGVGLAFVGAVLALARWASPRPPKSDDKPGRTDYNVNGHETRR
ncbi:MAG: hypothetical protein ACRDM0_17475 [Thermoleophilaceae bacterium]